VQFEMEYPAFWAWHDHSHASRLAHGAVYATYVGTWRKRFRVTQGGGEINRFVEKETAAVRSFCRRCGTPLIYERTRSPHMLNIPRALFDSRTGRQPIYHIGIEQMQDWSYAGEPLVPLKGYPGVFWKRSKKRGRACFLRSSATPKMPVRHKTIDSPGDCETENNATAAHGRPETGRPGQ
jgi:hypothetical protein